VTEFYSLDRTQIRIDHKQIHTDTSMIAAITLEEGLDYILSHFEGQPRLFPRMISTKTTEGRQVVVNSKEEALTRFAQANLLD
jgi:hypothetical protein